MPSPDAPAEGALPIRLVVGLGNPEPRYRTTRHNAGQMVVESLAERLGVRFGAKYAGRFAEARAPGGPVALLIPTTYMNLSGRSVGPARGSLHIETSQILVVHDELDLPFGSVRGKVGGGHGGHNGLRSIQADVGGGGFPRIRVGIGRPPDDFRGDDAAWVLAPFREAPSDVADVIGRARDMVDVALDIGIDGAIAQFHAREPGARRAERRPAADDVAGTP